MQQLGLERSLAAHPFHSHHYWCVQQLRRTCGGEVLCHHVVRHGPKNACTCCEVRGGGCICNRCAVVCQTCVVEKRLVLAAHATAFMFMYAGFKGFKDSRQVAIAIPGGEQAHAASCWLQGWRRNELIYCVLARACVLLCVLARAMSCSYYVCAPDILWQGLPALVL